MLLESKSKFATHQLEHCWDCRSLQASYDGSQQGKQSFVIMMQPSPFTIRNFMTVKAISSYQPLVQLLHQFAHLTILFARSSLAKLITGYLKEPELSYLLHVLIQ